MTARLTPLDVQRARLMIRLGEALNKPTPKYVRRIAEAKPVPDGAEATEQV